MHSRICRVLAGASLLLLLSSCGDDESSGGIAPGSTFPAAAVEDFGTTGAVLVDYAASSFDFGGTNIGLSAGPEGVGARATADLGRFARLSAAQDAGPRLVLALASPDCTPTQTGAATDTDADGIPDELTVEYTAENCTVTDTATGDVQVIRAFIRYRDTSNDLFGFEITVEDLRMDEYDGATGDWFRQTLTARERSRTTTSGGTWSLAFTTSIQQGTGDEVTYATAGGYDVSATYTSNGAVPAGGPIPDGAIDLSGTVDITSGVFGRLVTRLVTTVDIDYESSCPGAEGGELEMRLNGNAAEGVLVKFDGCGVANWEFLGSGTL
jgi:hypothetical protein